MAKTLANTDDRFDNIPLHLACMAGHAEAVDVLISAGANIDDKNEDEKTPCHLAAEGDHEEVLRLLLDRDPNAVNDKDEEDNTPLHLAARGGCVAALQLLLEYSASVFKRNDFGLTALDCAAEADSLQCAQLLLQKDSPVDSFDLKKNTPLHIAAKKGHHKLASLLLDHEASLVEKDSSDNNALELAILHRNRSVVETILEKDKKVWEGAFKSVNYNVNQILDASIPETPLRMLIRTFPDLAEIVFTKSISKVNQKEEDEVKKENELELDYQFLDDLERLKEDSKERLKIGLSNPDDEHVLNERNHPFMVMIESNQKQLLKHP